MSNGDIYTILVECLEI